MQNYANSEKTRDKLAPVSALRREPLARPAGYQLSGAWHERSADFSANHELDSEYILLAEAVNGFTADLHAMLGEIRSATRVVRQSTTEIRTGNCADGKFSSQASRGTAGEIDTVIGTITSIARQTSMLALDAAVAANRTGVHSGGLARAASNIRGVSGRYRN